MGRKKVGERVTPQATRPFCYFCDRTFDDESILIQHQRAKHFRCPECDDSVVRGKCESVQGLIVHTLKVHAKSLDRVPHAIVGRDSPQINVYGMDGIPAEILKQKGIERPEPLGAAAPPTQAQPPRPPDVPAMPFIGNGMPATCPPAGMPRMQPMPGIVSAASSPSPSFEGFQQFLAAQQAPPVMGVPSAPLSMPGAPEVSVFSPGFQQQAPLVPPLDRQLAPMPMPLGIPLAAGCNGCASAQLVPQKRPLEETYVAAEDVSVEERRALLDRYRIPR